MKIAIHHRPGSFSDRWIEYCQEKGIPYILVDARSASIIEEIKSCSAFLWHWSHKDFDASLMARQLLRSVEELGIPVYPNSNTCWHFDDKIGQKYLLEAIEAPLAPSWVFFSEASALEWINSTSFPKVFKLRKGAGSKNVRLIKSKKEAEKLTRTMFDKGIDAIPTLARDWQSEVSRVKKKDGSLLNTLLRAPGILRRLPGTLHEERKKSTSFGREKGYIYFQEFMPANKHDTRITVVGDKAFSFTRDVREGDFRASGSGIIDYAPERIDKAFLRIAFSISRRLGLQSCAMDFIYDPHGNPVLVEISYGFSHAAINNCPGYWTKELVWMESHFRLQDLILENLLEDSRSRFGGCY